MNDSPILFGCIFAFPQKMLTVLKELALKTER